MNTRLVLWGEIGTDRKALVAIHLEEETAKIHIYAFPKEQVTKEIQDTLFVEWKNGGEFEFPESAIHWEVDANSDTILPENVKVDRPEVVLQSQHKWSKKLMGSKINQLLTDETKWIEEKASAITEFDQALWDKAKAQWEKIASYQKKNEISWEQTTVLKEKINEVFDMLKAVKRINSENDDQANSVLLKQFNKRIDELQSKLIYSDQWKYIFEELKKIQQELKTAPFRWNHKRTLYNTVNTIFDDLRKYRMTEVVTKTKGRVSQLGKILDGLKDSISRDTENYNMQVEKMQHYTRGKLPPDEIKSRFSYILDRIKEKELKADGIKQTITQLKNDIEKEKQQHEEREQQRLKREQEQANKKHDDESGEIIPEELQDEGSEIKAVTEKLPGKRTHNKRLIQKLKPKETETKNMGDNPKQETASAEQEQKEETTIDNKEDEDHSELMEEHSSNVTGQENIAADNKDSEAEKILAENNEGLEPIIEADSATVELENNATTEKAVPEHHDKAKIVDEDHEAVNLEETDSAEEQIEKTAEKARNNPD